MKGAKTGFEFVPLTEVPTKMVPFKKDKPQKDQRPLPCRSATSNSQNVFRRI
jgi:hypothetical protein